MHTGFIALHRKLLQNPIFDNPALLKMWLWCLLKATHTEHEQIIGLEVIKLNKGQFITGRIVGAKELNVNESTWYKHIKLLERLEMISLNSNNKYTVVSVVNWELYQVEKKESNNKITTKEQQNNTNNNDNKDNKDNIDTVVDFFREKLHLLPQPRKITAKRKEHINSRIKEYGLDVVLDVLAQVEQSDFLMGKVKPFKADMDWIFNVNNFVKVVEGKYKNRDTSTTKVMGLIDYESPLGEREKPW